MTLSWSPEKRELTEKKLRAKLEEELKILRHGQENGGSNIITNGENNDQLRQKLSLFEEKVVQVQSCYILNFSISGNPTRVREDSVGAEIS